MTGRPCSVSSSPLSRASKVHTGPAWRTFALSRPLQPGIWLLCRLRPLASALAFSCPAEAGQASESSPVPTPTSSSTLGCLLYTERTSRQSTSHVGNDAAAAFPFWAGCVSHFHPFEATVLTQVSRVNIGGRDSPVIRLWLTEAGTLSAGFTRRQVPLTDACRITPTPLLRHGPSLADTGAVKGRTQRHSSEYGTLLREVLQQFFGVMGWRGGPGAAKEGVVWRRGPKPGNAMCRQGLSGGDGRRR